MPSYQIREIWDNIERKALHRLVFPEGVDLHARPAECSDLQEKAWAKTLGYETLVTYPRNTSMGYHDRTINPGWIRYHNVQDLLARFFLTLHANLGNIRNWRDYCIGVTSRISQLDLPGAGVAGAEHMPMFDYDGKNIKTKVKADVKKLQKDFGLGDATLYRTRSGIHVYFFSDRVPVDSYKSMLESIECCAGFKRKTLSQGYAVLRISAKYTDFDIDLYKVLVSPNRTGRRPGRKAALIRAFLQIGQDCGTHLASLYPQWAHYREDPAPWTPPAKREPRKRIRKISAEVYHQLAEGSPISREVYHQLAEGSPISREEYHQLAAGMPLKTLKTELFAKMYNLKSPVWLSATKTGWANSVSYTTNSSHTGNGTGDP